MGTREYLCFTLTFIYHRIYGKNLTASFSKSMLYLIGQIEES